MTTDRSEKPDRTEAAEYYFRYIDLAPSGDICDGLEAQMSDTLAFLRQVPDGRAGYRYAEGKWTVREVLSHINDTERLFAFRAFWFARGFDSPLPSFEQEVAVRHADADSRTWTSHVEEFAAVRAATVQLFASMPAGAWLRRGVASGNPFTVRALAHIAAGHVTHHTMVLRERYL